MTTEDTRPIDATATERKSESLAKQGPTADVPNLGTIERCDPQLVPHTLDELATLISRCLQTDDPRGLGIPPMFHCAVARGVSDALSTFRDLAEGQKLDEYARTLGDIIALIEPHTHR